MRSYTTFEDTYPAEYYDIHRHCLVRRDFGTRVPILAFDIDRTSSRTERPRWLTPPRFHTGTRVLDVPVRIGSRRGIVSVSDWDRGLACSPAPFDFTGSLSGLCDQTVVEELQLRPDPGMAGQWPVEYWAASIPRGVREAVRPFAAVQFLLMRCLKMERRLEEILHSNPALVLCAAHHFQSTFGVRAPAGDLVEILMKPRRQICALALGLDTGAVVKLLAGIRLDSYDEAAVRKIRDSLYYRESVRALRRLRRLTPEMLEAAAQSPDLVGATCVRRTMSNTALDSDECCQRSRKMLQMGRDILSMARNLDIPRAEIAPRVRACRTGKALCRLHDQLATDLHRRDIEKSLRRYEAIHGKKPLPDPPLRGTAHIRPITTYRELCSEGRIMHHCAQAHLDQVLSGKFYIYSVHAPQRATVEIHERGGQWAINQISLACNGRPSKETHRAVREWLDARNR